MGWESEQPWARLNEELATVPRLDGNLGELPFGAGWVGFVGYEIGTSIERIAPRTPDRDGPPMARFDLHDASAIFDHEKECWCASAVEWNDDAMRRRGSASDRLREVRRFLEHASRLTPSPLPTVEASAPECELSREEYLDRVRRVLRYIEAGDVYQVNLSRRLIARTSASDIDLYRRLRTVSPSSHAALLRWGGGSILSSSPELFLDLRGRRVITRPIKGTRPRGLESWKDETLLRELADSEKDHAELNMIVDLLRNDLGRVCEYGSVRVIEPRTIESHPTVFHQVATIEGTLCESESARTLLAAALPGGSITGAPKIRAMQIIRELEPSARGVYCGSIGWIGLSGDASFNIAIRTMFQRGRRVELHAGGGIVIDSTPEAEYDETQVKLRGMLAALGCSPVDAPGVPMS